MEPACKRMARFYALWGGYILEGNTISYGKCAWKIRFSKECVYFDRINPSSEDKVGIKLSYFESQAFDK
jgi:hypothetical protein